MYLFLYKGEYKWFGFSLDMNQFNTVPGDSLRYLFNLKELNLSSNLLTELTDSSFDEE